MEAIKNWLECIVVIIVIIGIIEVIVPEGEMKRFVLLITQITISIVIAIPILKFFKSDISIEELFNVSYIEENDFYISALKNSLDKHVNILETVYSENIIKEFNLRYHDMQISECEISFTKDINGKIIEINLIEVTSEVKVDDVNLLKSRVSKLCEVDKSKVRVK